MSKNHVSRAESAKRAIRTDHKNGAEELTALARGLEWLRAASDDSLGAAIVRHGSCLDALPGGDRPGWLFDHETAPDVAARVCAGCPVRDECLELELRLFGAQRLGMWGALGENGRVALHPVWLRVRESAADVDAAGRGGDR